VGKRGWKLSKEDKGWEEKWEKIKKDFVRLEKELYERIEERIDELGRFHLREEEGEVRETGAREGSGRKRKRGNMV